MAPKTHRTEFEFGQLAAICLKRWWVVACCVLAGFLAALLISACLITPKYRANVSFYVSTDSGVQSALTAVDLTAARLLADTCIGLLDSDTALERVAASAETDFTADELRDRITAERIGETPLLRVSVLHRDPETAARIAEAVAEILPDTAQELVGGCSVQVVDHARTPTEPDSPDVPKSCILGAFSGLILSVAGFAVSLLVAGRPRKEEAACEQ